MIRYVQLEQGTQEWLDFRKLKIGSSYAASILGVGFRTPLQLFEDILEDKSVVPNEAMIRGTLMEPIAREWLNRKYNSELKPVVVEHPNPSHNWHFSSIDALWERPDGSIFVAEIKHPGAKDHGLAMQGIVPPKYVPQCLHILEDLPGVDRILYCSYREESQAEIWIERNEYEMAIQFAEELAFYSKLITLRPPEPTEKDWITISDEEAIEIAKEYKMLTDQISSMEKQADDLKKKIIEKMGYTNRARIGDLKAQKVIRQGGVDYSKIEALKGLDLNPYRKEPISTWRLSF